MKIFVILLILTLNLCWEVSAGHIGESRRIINEYHSNCIEAINSEDVLRFDCDESRYIYWFENSICYKQISISLSSQGEIDKFVSTVLSDGFVFKREELYKSILFDRRIKSRMFIKDNVEIIVYAGHYQTGDMGYMSVLIKDDRLSAPPKVEIESNSVPPILNTENKGTGDKDVVAPSKKPYFIILSLIAFIVVVLLKNGIIKRIKLPKINLYKVSKNTLRWIGFVPAFVAGYVLAILTIKLFLWLGNLFYDIGNISIFGIEVDGMYGEHRIRDVIWLLVAQVLGAYTALMWARDFAPKYKKTILIILSTLLCVFFGLVISIIIIAELELSVKIKSIIECSGIFIGVVCFWKTISENPRLVLDEDKLQKNKLKSMEDAIARLEALKEIE